MKNKEKDMFHISGLWYAALFFVGLVVSITGLFLIYVNIILGDVIWFIGALLIFYLTRRNFNEYHKKTDSQGMELANFILKVLVLSALFFIWVFVNLTYFLSF